jgi:hypothetical protein
MQVPLQLDNDIQGWLPRRISRVFVPRRISRLASARSNIFCPHPQIPIIRIFTTPCILSPYSSCTVSPSSPPEPTRATTAGNGLKTTPSS